MAADGQTIIGEGANVRGWKWKARGRRGALSASELADKRQLKDDNLAQVKDGQSTKNDVLRLLGMPVTVTTESSHPNQETWTYLQVSPGGGSAVIVVMVNGIVISHSKSAVPAQ